MAFPYDIFFNLSLHENSSDIMNHAAASEVYKGYIKRPTFWQDLIRHEYGLKKEGATGEDWDYIHWLYNYKPRKLTWTQADQRDWLQQQIEELSLSPYNNKEIIRLNDLLLPLNVEMETKRRQKIIDATYNVTKDLVNMLVKDEINAWILDFPLVTYTPIETEIISEGQWKAHSYSGALLAFANDVDPIFFHTFVNNLSLPQDKDGGSMTYTAQNIYDYLMYESEPILVPARSG